MRTEINMCYEVARDGVDSLLSMFYSPIIGEYWEREVWSHHLASNCLSSSQEEELLSWERVSCSDFFRHALAARDTEDNLYRQLRRT